MTRPRFCIECQTTRPHVLIDSEPDCEAWRCDHCESTYWVSKVPVPPQTEMTVGKVLWIVVASLGTALLFGVFARIVKEWTW